MRVAVYYNNNDIRIEEAPIPNISKRELLIEISMCGICGSDVMEWYRVKKAPRILGHEVVGVVKKVGERVENFNIGDRIFVSHHVPCDECHYCMRGAQTACDTLHKTNIDPGGFAEYARIPPINVTKGVFSIPDSLSDEEGVFIEPLGCVIRAQDKLNICSGDTVLVLGSGVSGILHIQLARLRGASQIFSTDIHEARLRHATDFGVDDTINAREDVFDQLKVLNDGRAADHVIVSTSASIAIKQAFDCVNDGGNIHLFAPAAPGNDFDLNLNDFWSRQITLTTSYAASPYNLARALEIIQSGAINVRDMITHCLALNKIQDGFNLVTEAKDCLKVVIEPHR